MKTVGRYAIETTTSLGFEQAVAKVTELLKEQGFGVLTEIDVAATFKKKLDLDHKPYVILGACNPPFAHQALTEEEHVGVLLPCNVVVWDDGDHRVVAAMEPRIMAEVIDSPALRQIAEQVSERIHEVIRKIG